MDKVIIFDIETNAIKDFGTLLGLKTIHCIALAINDEEPKLLPISEALEEMSTADILIGHNIQIYHQQIMKLKNGLTNLVQQISVWY